MLAIKIHGKIASALQYAETLWRDGRAAEGACLENMFGSHQRGFESHSLRLRRVASWHVDRFSDAIRNMSTFQLENLQTQTWGGARVVEWGRLLSGYRGEIL